MSAFISLWQALAQRLSIVALLVSSVALVVAFLNYRRKTGVLIRGTFTTTSGIDCDDPYISEVILENSKDRAVAIFSIFLRAGANVYIKIEDFDSQSMILGPFGTYHKRYGPIEFYAHSTSRVKLAKTLEDPTLRKRLVLSTSQGKHVIRSPISRWDPALEFFANYFTNIIVPVRARYKGEDLGGNVRYVVEVTNSGGEKEVVRLRPDDYRFQMFRGFALTPESLSTKAKLREFLQTQIDKGNLVCADLNVLDVDEWRAEAHKSYLRSEPHEIQSCGPLQYHVIGFVWTKFSSWQTRRENKRRLRGS